MPQDYNAMFGGGPVGAYYSLQDRDLERAKTQQAMQAEQGTMEATRLSNMFAEQNNPMKLQQQQLVNEGLGYKNKDDSLDLDYKQQTHGYKITNDVAEFVKKAKQADLDLLQLQAQQMAYSPDPKTSAEGQRQLLLHRDFLKLREQGEQKVDLLNTRTEAAKALEGVKQGNRLQLKGTPSARAPSSGGGSGRVTAPSIGKITAQALLDLESDDPIAVARAKARLEAIRQNKEALARDANAGKPMLGPDGTIVPTPPRPSPYVPSNTPPKQMGTPKPSLPSGWTMK